MTEECIVGGDYQTFEAGEYVVRWDGFFPREQRPDGHRGLRTTGSEAPAVGRCGEARVDVPHRFG